MLGKVEPRRTVIADHVTGHSNLAVHHWFLSLGLLLSALGWAVRLYVATTRLPGSLMNELRTSLQLH